MELPVTPKPLPASAAKLPLDHIIKLSRIVTDPLVDSAHFASSQMLVGWRPRVGSLTGGMIEDFCYRTLTLLI
ncbi:hypothetical protein DSO57_1003130 [Entomophthora muscae]|uniref:Uncharacterized protein n=1 Tax=Entomophthora muscae TaxID=34485 RepID=A0ACC2RNE1_9FUNG|nr:hypothetical protein DSO57_1003130 [Entomophthora muscae]